MTEEKKDYTKTASDKGKKIVAAIKEKTAMTAYQLTIKENSQPDIFDSKFGGVPYWDMTKEYPTDATGNKMMLLAQINFTKAALDDERLPKEGLLQFFIASEDDVYGMDSDMIDGEDYVLWGDCGVANFFINSEALKKKDFSKVMYNWDCC